MGLAWGDGDTPGVVRAAYAAAAATAGAAAGPAGAGAGAAAGAAATAAADEWGTGATAVSVVIGEGRRECWFCVSVIE